MICTVIDNFFDKKFLYDFSTLIENEIEFFPNNIANRTTWPYGFVGSHKLFASCIFSRESINRIVVLHEKSSIFFDLFESVQNKILNKPLYLKRIDVNLQHTHCDGTWHKDSSEDPNEMTIMIMSNSNWEYSWGGKFQILSECGNEVVEEYEYIPGRILIFPSSCLHRGLGPTEKYVYRHTVVYRVSDL